MLNQELLQVKLWVQQSSTGQEPREAALFLEDLRWELQQHPDVTIYF